MAMAAAESQVHDASTMVRNVNRASGINPFALCNCADLGDTPVNPVDLQDSLTRIQNFYETLRRFNVAPLPIGGDHLVSLPILRAQGKNAPVGMVHFDAHTDTWARSRAFASSTSTSSTNSASTPCWPRPAAWWATHRPM